MLPTERRRFVGHNDKTYYNIRYCTLFEIFFILENKRKDKRYMGLKNRDSHIYRTTQISQNQKNYNYTMRENFWTRKSIKSFMC